MVMSMGIFIVQKYSTDHTYGNKFVSVVRDLPACDVAGTHSRLACVATLRCWHNSKVIHCTKKYWGTNTTMGKYEPARQFFSVAMQFSPSCFAPPAVTLHLCPSVLPSPAVYLSPSLFGFLLSPLTLRVHSSS